MHDMIDDKNLDLLVLTETWIDSKAPPAIKKDIAPEGYVVIHAHRSGQKVRGGDNAVVYRDTLKLAVLLPTGEAPASSFEILRLKVTHKKRSVNLMCIYLPPPAASSLFMTELTDLCDELESLPGYAVLCGDFKFPGSDETHVDTRLEQLLAGSNYRQHVQELTRGGNGSNSILLDLVISRTDPIPIISDHIAVHDVGFLDHSLVIFSLAVPRMRAISTKFSYRDHKFVDLENFKKLLKDSSFSRSPPLGIDDYMLALETDTTTALNTVAPLQTRTKRLASRPLAKSMTAEATEAKRLSRRLQRRISKIKCTADFVVYRQACRKSTKKMPPLDLRTTKLEYWSLPATVVISGEQLKRCYTQEKSIQD